MTKRIFSILLALCMVFAFMPASAFAADSDITLTADKTKVSAGDTVKITVNVPSYTGKSDDGLTDIQIKYTYNSNVFDGTFETSTYQGITAQTNCTPNDTTGIGTAIFTTAGFEKKTIDAEQIVATFTVKENAPAGQYTFGFITEDDENFIGESDGTLYPITLGSDLTIQVVGEAADQTVAVEGGPEKTATYGETIAPLTVSINDTDITATNAANYGELSVESSAADVVKAEINADKKVQLTALKAGKAKITVKAAAVEDTYKAGYSEFDITVAPKTVDNPTIEGIDASKVYTGEAITFDNVVVKDGDTVIPASEYTLEYTGNKEVGTATVTVKDNEGGNYTVSGSKNFDITKADFAGTTTHTEKATKGSKVTCDLVKDLKLPADATFAKGTVADADAILDGDATITTEGKLTFKFKEDAATGKTATIPVTVTSKNYKDFDITITAEVKDAGSTGGGGGGIIIPPTVQKPEIKLVEATMGKAELSADGTTATITPNDGYEIDKVTVNDKEVTITDNKITGLKAGDKVVVTFKAKAAPEPEFDVQKYVSDLKLVARSTKTAKGNIKVAVKTVTDQNGTAVNLSDLKDKGYTVKYKFYRSNKKASKYAAKTEKTIDKNSYVNTTGKKGTKYFYKVRVMVYDNDGKLVAKSELKQCKYASRTWTKK